MFPIGSEGIPGKVRYLWRRFNDRKIGVEVRGGTRIDHDQDEIVSLGPKGELYRRHSGLESVEPCLGSL
jgi:hypothetical protein